VVLRDSEGKLADSIFVGLCDPRSVLGADAGQGWHGPNLQLLAAGKYQMSWQRVGRYNNRNSQDWHSAAPTLGSPIA